MTTQLEVGDIYGIETSSAGTDHAIKGVPPWMEWAGTRVAGNAELPSGFRRITLAGHTLNLPAVVWDESVDIAPVILPADARSPWRVAIFEPGGAYIIANGLDGAPTIGTPKVRLTRSAPSKATVRLALGHGRKNILGQYDGWSDGTPRPIARGMEVTVEYRDASTGALTPAFRGRIFQIESREEITVTAYDRLMDLYQTTGQYLSHAGQTQGARSTGRTTSGTDYIYETGVQLGILTGIDSIDRLDINGSGATGSDLNTTLYDIIIHGLPTAGGVTPAAGDVITRIQTKYSAKMTGYFRSGTVVPNVKTAAFTLKCTAYIFEDTGSGFTLRATGSAPDITRAASSTSTAAVPFSIEAVDQTADITLGTPYTISDPSRVYIGIKVTMGVAIHGVSSIGLAACGPNKSSTRYTTGGVSYYNSTDDGVSWSEYTASAKPEMGVTFTHPTNAISPGTATVSGTTVIIPQGSIPAGPSDTYLSTEETGVGILVDYYEADKAPLADIVKELIEAAGLNPETANANLGLVTLYTIVTTDYLTAIHEIIDARGYGIKDSIMDAGTIALLPEHTPDENPVLSISTDPQGAGDKVILSHNLTAHWASEKATVAYIAENATSSGLPLALETDDGLMDGSLIEAIQAPMSGVTVDNTLGTHDIMANTASGAIRKLHTNTIEGTVILGGYYPGIWDISGAGIGGLPILLDVPEYQAQGVVIPTEVEIGDGITTARLDNIRTQDRSGLAHSMGLVEGSVSNDATLLPQTVYIFGKADEYNQIGTGETFQSIDGITLIREDGTTISQTSATYLRAVSDAVGYLHLLAVLPEAAGTYTSTSPIIMAVAEITTSGGTERITALVPPKYVLDNQNIHIDIRLRNA